VGVYSENSTDTLHILEDDFVIPYPHSLSQIGYSSTLSQHLNWKERAVYSYGLFEAAQAFFTQSLNP